MSESKSYKGMFKATVIFGGTQVFQIITNLVRAKIVAVFLGPSGLGIYSLLISSATMVNNITGLGIAFSSVRNIALAKEHSNIIQLSTTIIIIRRCLLFAAILGCLSFVVFAKKLSIFSFGSNEYTLSLIFISITLFFNTISSGEIAIMQGLGRMKSVAAASAVASVIGLVLSLPMYVYWGTDGIAPSLVLISFFVFLVNKWVNRRIIVQNVSVSLKKTFVDGRSVVRVGFFMMIGTFMGSVMTYLINAYIRATGSVDDIGLYQAGISITNQYVGLVFASMAADYYPRLSIVSHDSIKSRIMVNQQTEMVMLIVVPLLVVIMLTAPVLISLLLSVEFLSIIAFVRWVSLGLLFKAASYPLGFISLARGDMKTFLFLEVVLGNAIVLISNVLGYRINGVTGIGVSFLIAYILYFAACVIVAKLRFGFVFNFKFIRIFTIAVFTCFFSFLITFFFENIYGYLLTGLILVASIYYSYNELNKKMNFSELIKNRLHK